MATSIMMRDPGLEKTRQELIRLSKEDGKAWVAKRTGCIVTLEDYTDPEQAFHYMQKLEDDLPDTRWVLDGCYYQGKFYPRKVSLTPLIPVDGHGKLIWRVPSPR